MTMGNPDMNELPEDETVLATGEVVDRIMTEDDANDPTI